MPFSHRSILTLLMCASLATLSPWLGSRPVHASSQRALTTVRVGYIPLVSLLGYYSAIEHGYFTKENLDVKGTIMAGGATIMPAIQGGSIDIGVSNPVSLLLGKASGLNMVVVTHGQFETRAHPTNAILVAKDSSIRSARDLDGKTFAVNTLNGIAHIGVQQWIKDHGGDPSKVHFTELGFPQMLAPLAHGQIDAAAEAEPFVEIGRTTLSTRVLGHQFADEQKSTLVGFFVAQRAWARTHAGLVARFARAYNKGQAWADKHPDVARTYLTKYVNMSPDLAVKTPLQKITKIKVSDFTYWQTLSRRWHAMTTKVNVKTLIWPTAAK